MAINSYSLDTPKGFTSRSYQQTGASSQVLWDNIHDGAGTSSGSDIKTGWSLGTNWNAVLYRAYLTFDTSAIPSDATITDAYVKISGTEYWRNAARDCVIGSIPSTINYGNLKTTTNYGTWEHSGSGSGMSSATFTNDQIDFNATGRSAINKSGDTTLSWRYENDQSDTQSLSSDSYNYVVITSATLYVTYQADETKTFTETITISSNVSKGVSKLLSEVVKVNSWIVGHGTDFIKLFTETITVSEAFIGRILQDYVKVFYETIKIQGLLSLLLNGKATDIWNKTAKLLSSWTKAEKISTIWTKAEKTSTIWTKEDKGVSGYVPDDDSGFVDG